MRRELAITGPLGRWEVGGQDDHCVKQGTVGCGRWRDTLSRLSRLNDGAYGLHKVKNRRRWGGLSAIAIGWVATTSRQGNGPSGMQSPIPNRARLSFTTLGYYDCHAWLEFMISPETSWLDILEGTGVSINCIAGDATAFPDQLRSRSPVVCRYRGGTHPGNANIKQGPAPGQSRGLSWLLGTRPYATSRPSRRPSVQPARWRGGEIRPRDTPSQQTEVPDYISERRIFQHRCQLRTVSDPPILHLSSLSFGVWGRR
jgi:hypothetical protein